MLQLFDLIKVVVGTQWFRLKVNYSYTLLIQSTFQVAALYSLLFASSSGQSNATSASYRFVGSSLLKESRGPILISEVPAARSQ